MPSLITPFSSLFSIVFTPFLGKKIVIKHFHMNYRELIVVHMNYRKLIAGFGYYNNLY